MGHGPSKDSTSRAWYRAGGPFEREDAKEGDPVEYPAVVKRLPDGRHYARCNSAPQGLAEAYGNSRDEAVDTLRKEIRYQLEYCPCSAVADEYVELRIAEQAPPKGNVWPG